MSRHYLFFMPPGGKDVQTALRRGLTLVEILIAVALMTILMLAAVRVLSYVSSSLSQAQNAMVIAGRARTAQLQIERDLACITAPLTPPLRFDDAPGYVQIVEGLGAGYADLQRRRSDGSSDGSIGWKLTDIAINSETGEYDSTIGDCDDIIMFTARAPGDSMFRGLVGGVVTESKEAEICYFLRGTTLYRRVLLIIPDEQLQTALQTKDASGNYLYFPELDTMSGHIKSTERSAMQGYGFYRDFDVSVRLERNEDLQGWCVKANTLADLTRRENRFGHAINGDNTSVANPIRFPYSIYTNPIWYYLRLPTLAECTMLDTCSWRVGTQIAQPTVYSASPSISKRPLEYDDGDVDEAYRVFHGTTTNWVGTGVVEFETGKRAIDTPYIDYWKNPLPWKGRPENPPALTREYQSLAVGTPFYDEPSTSTSTFRIKQPRVNEDVLLTNVISFDIKVWCAETKEFIDLGQHRSGYGTDGRENAQHLGSQGFYGTSDGSSCYSDTGTYGNGYWYGLLPCVYDTWTDAYENDATNSIIGRSSQPFLGIGVDPAFDGQGITDIMEHVDKWRCPPPYNVPLTGIQIKIRVFDPDTKNIREVTIRRNYN